MRQWYGVSGNAVLNTRWPQFINQANYKIIDSNVMDCANVTKTPTLPSVKRYSPPDEDALYRDNFATGKGEPSKIIADIAQSDGNVFFVFHDLNTNYKCLRCRLSICNKCSVFVFVSDTLFSELYVIQIFSFYFFAINCQRMARRALYFGISLASPSSN